MMCGILGRSVQGLQDSEDTMQAFLTLLFALDFRLVDEFDERSSPAPSDTFGKATVENNGSLHWPRIQNVLA